MPDRNSSTSINSENYGEPVIEEATVGVKTDPISFNQLSSSAEAAKNTRKQKAVGALEKAVDKAMEKVTVTSSERGNDIDRPGMGGTTK